MRRRLAALALLCCVQALLTPLDAQQGARRAGAGRILTIGNLTYTDVEALDRERTLFLLPVGMLEEHGPHLPIGSDQIGVDYEAGQVAKRLSRALPGWNVVMMPSINYGATGANQVNGIPIHPGTYAIRQSTLRSMVADIGGQIVQNGFKWIFVMNGHGAPPHHIAVNDASDFVSEVFNATMLNVSALFTADSAWQAQGSAITAKFFTPAALSAIGLDLHAGTSETSGVLAIRPDLVRAGYRRLPDVRAQDIAQMHDIANQPGWQGYWSSPSRATAKYGHAIEAWWVDGMTSIILRAVRGENMRQRPRFPGSLRGVPAVQRVIDNSLEPERAFERQFERWLAQRPKGE